MVRTRHAGIDFWGVPPYKDRPPVSTAVNSCEVAEFSRALIKFSLVMIRWDCVACAAHMALAVEAIKFALK